MLCGGLELQTDGLAYLGSDFLHAGSRRAGAGVELGDVGVREAVLRHQINRLLEVLLCLPREPTYYVGCELNPWNQLQQRVRTPLELCMQLYPPQTGFKAVWGWIAWTLEHQGNIPGKQSCNLKSSQLHAENILSAGCGHKYHTSIVLGLKFLILFRAETSVV